MERTPRCVGSILLSGREYFGAAIGRKDSASRRLVEESHRSRNSSLVGVIPLKLVFTRAKDAYAVSRNKIGDARNELRHISQRGRGV
jgi:hypothetical protein